MNREECSECIFWFEKEYANIQLRWGKCKRYPPPIAQSNLIGLWLETESTEWCGEFKKE